MIIISEAARFRQRVIKYSFKKGVTAESRYFRGSRNTIYECRNKTSNTIPKTCLNFLSPNKVSEKYLGVMQESLQQSLQEIFYILYVLLCLLMQLQKHEKSLPLCDFRDNGGLFALAGVQGLELRIIDFTP